jgi:hypothetical protein
METISLEEIIKLADPITNVIILEGDTIEEKYDTIYNGLDFQFWDDDESLGPECNLCRKIITDISTNFTLDGIVYTIIWKGDLENEDKDFYSLQCTYCLNYFHKSDCSLSMSDSTYLNILKSKQWSCPICVPEFAMNNVVLCDKIDYSKLLFKLAKILNPLLDQLLFSFNSFSEISIDELFYFLKLLFEVG